jgi:serine/threonine-protein kinase
MPVAEEIVDSRFEIRGRLGHGGCGVVYEAMDRKTSRLVALKVLAEDATDPAAMARLVREARVVSAINHPNVCRVAGSGVLDDGRHFISTELLVGQTLRVYLERRPPLGVEEAIEIGVQLLSGLEAAHHVGVVHRDVKPENVFVTWSSSSKGRDGRDGRARQGPACIKLLDFGLCRRADAVDERTLTIAGCIVGTPGYLAPEQVRGDRAIDPTVDLFAVGLILFEALTGHRAMTGNTPLELITTLLTKPIPAVRSIRPEIPISLDRIVAHAVERAVRARYQSAADFQHELLEARTAIRREGSRSAAAREKASRREEGRDAPARSADDWDVPTRRRTELNQPDSEPPVSSQAHPTAQALRVPRNRRWLRHG